MRRLSVELPDPAYVGQARKTLPKLFERLGCANPSEGWRNFLGTLGETEQEQMVFLSKSSSGELLAVKFLRSIQKCVEEGEQPDQLLAGLLEDRRQSVLPRISDSEILPKIHAIFGLSSKDTSIVRGYTASLSKNLSWSDRSRLGTVFLVQDSMDRLINKLRLTEQQNPNGMREWNVGVASQDQERGRVTEDQRKHLCPGQVYHSNVSMVNRTFTLSLARVAHEYGIGILDLRAEYYHLYRALTFIGAEFDQKDPRMPFEKERMETFDRQLDAAGIKRLRQRSWAVFDGAVIDPDTGKPGLEWVSPRLIWHTEPKG